MSGPFNQNNVPIQKEMMRQTPALDWNLPQPVSEEIIVVFTAAQPTVIPSARFRVRRNSSRYMKVGAIIARLFDVASRAGEEVWRFCLGLIFQPGSGFLFIYGSLHILR